MNNAIETLPQEDCEHKARSTRTKFMMQMMLGIGGATVFGLVAGLVGAAIGPMGISSLIAGSAIAGWPLLIGIAAVGFGALWLGSRYMAENIMNDQTHQAKKIAKETGQTRTQPAIETTLTPIAIPGIVSTAKEEAAETQPGNFADRILAERSMASVASPTAANTNQSWGDRARASAALGTALGA